MSGERHGYKVYGILGPVGRVVLDHTDEFCPTPVTSVTPVVVSREEATTPAWSSVGSTATTVGKTSERPSGTPFFSLRRYVPHPFYRRSDRLDSNFFPPFNR